MQLEIVPEPEGEPEPQLVDGAQMVELVHQRGARRAGPLARDARLAARVKVGDVDVHFEGMAFVGSVRHVGDVGREGRRGDEDEGCQRPQLPGRHRLAP
jgi:hypothetical protein